MVLACASVLGSGHMIIRTDIKSLAAQTSEPEKLQKIRHATLSEPTADNIVELQPVIDKWVSEHPDQTWAVAIKSVDGPSFAASHNADKKFDSASIYKLLLVQPLFEQIPVEQQKSMSIMVNGKPRTIATCLDLMIRLSHNECGEAVGKRLNWSQAQKVLNNAGYKNTVFSTRGLQTTAGDTAAFLENLQGDMLNRIAKEAVLKSMREQRWREGIPAGCPGCVTATKTGSNNGAVHDAGIIRYGSGTYVLAIFSEKSSFKEIAELTGRIHQQILDTTTP